MLDRLPCVDVQPEQVRLFVGRELREEADGEVVPLHDVPDGRVVREAGQECARGVGLGEVREGLDAVEGILGGRAGGRRPSGADLTRPSAMCLRQIAAHAP